MPPYLRTLRNVQVIAFALITGLVILIAISFFMLTKVKVGGFLGGQGPVWNQVPVMTLVMSGVGALILIMSFIVPPAVTAMNVKPWRQTIVPPEQPWAEWERDDPAWLERVPASTLAGLLQVFQTDRLLKLALSEAAGVIGVMGSLLESLGLAIGVMLLAVVAMVWHVPTQRRLLEWLAKQVRG
jgi:hypothetical protein